MKDDLLISSMMQPQFYPHQVHEVKLVETHISYVFLTEARVYKVKKKVDFGFLDFSTLAKRKWFCEEELRLNSRLAPDVYLQVMPIYRDAQGQLTLEQEPGLVVVEYALQMVRLPEEGMLSHLLSQDQASSSLFFALAEKLVRFHQTAATLSKEKAAEAVQCVASNMQENFQQTRNLQGQVVSSLRFRVLSDYSRWFLRSHREILNRRALEGQFREGHGDLRIKHICVYQDDLIVFDCIEFNERFRFIDVAADLSFLLMDLEFHGYWSRARDLIRGYLDLSQDLEIRLLLNFYKCYYACTRAKVAGIRSTEAEAKEQSRALQEAAAYFDLAFKYATRLVRPSLILICGLMGTGKSTLARNIAPFLGAEILRSDVLRKELLQIPEEEKHESAFGQGIYSKEITRLTYARLFSQAAKNLHSGGSIILDASFSTRKHRELARQTAHDFGARFLILECVCREAVIRERLKRRLQDPHEPSDGRWGLYAAQKNHFEAIEDSSRNCHLQIDTEVPGDLCRDETLERVLHCLRVDGPCQFV